MTTDLVLDARQRAMLAEMGVRVWLPSSEVTVTPARHTPIVEAPSAAQALVVPVRREPPLRLPVMDAPPASASLTATRYVIGNLPTDATSYDLVVLGEPCQGVAEQLLANLLKILAQSSPRIFIAQMVASHNDAVDMHEQLTAIPTKLVLALGPHAAKAMLGTTADGIPFSKLRGTVHAQSKPPTIVTYHPQQMLRQPAAKASSWQDVRLVLRTIAKS